MKTLTGFIRGLLSHTTSDAFLQPLAQLQYISSRPRACDPNATGEGLILITRQFPLQPTVSQVLEVPESALAASPHCSYNATVHGFYPAFDFGCSPLIRGTKPPETHGISVAIDVDGLGLPVDCTDIGVVCLPGIGQIRLCRLARLSPADRLQVTCRVFRSFNKTYRICCSEKQAHHLFCLKVHLNALREIDIWLSVVRGPSVVRLKFALRLSRSKKRISFSMAVFRRIHGVRRTGIIRNGIRRIGDVCFGCWRTNESQGLGEPVTSWVQ